jgi:hypothetical protein
MRVTALLLCAALLVGCATPGMRVTVIPVPAGLLEPCSLPPVGELNPDLSAAFVQAYQCAEMGNRDKERIREWQDSLRRR